jgi:hypothetical protein
MAMSMELLTQARHLQTDVDAGRSMEHLFSTFKQVHSKILLILYCWNYVIMHKDFIEKKI